jgi:hypothetical protein
MSGPFNGSRQTSWADEMLPDMTEEGGTEKPWPPKPFQHEVAKARPPSQRTRKMEKNLEKMLLKRYEEAKDLEKKKGKK